MPALVRSAALTQFAEMARGHGLDARALVSEAGLPAACLDDPDLKVSTAAVARLLETAAARAGEPAFGLRMAESRRLSNLGPLGLLVREEPTLRDALRGLARYIHVHNESIVITVEDTGGLVVLREDLVVEGGAPVRQSVELSLGVTFRVLQVLLGASWWPRLVCFAHAAPKDASVHHRVFGPAVEFRHEFNGIVCNRADLDRPNPGADAVMARYARHWLEAGARRSSSMGDRVTQLAVVLLPRGHCRVEVVARHLGVDRRTIARRLDAEGTSFSGIVDGLRTALVRRYLADGSRPLGEVAALLGFSAPSAFSRWHRQRFGSPPSLQAGGQARPL